jgi:hypothetical protein
LRIAAVRAGTTFEVAVRMMPGVCADAVTVPAVVRTPAVVPIFRAALGRILVEA